jgi:hypothetical protein
VGGEQRKWRANEKWPAAVAVDQTALPWKLEINPCRLFSIRWSLGPANHLPSPHAPPNFFLAGGGRCFRVGVSVPSNFDSFLFGLRSLIPSLGSLARSFCLPRRPQFRGKTGTLSLSLSLSLCAIYNTSIATLGLWMLYTNTCSSFLFCIPRCTENTPKLIITEVYNSTAALKPAILMLLQCRRRLLKFMICRFPCEWIVFGLE